jgi:hypothetical protein
VAGVSRSAGSSCIKRENLPYRKEAEVISFEHAWREGGIHRKRELQNALFPEGLTWWIKRRVFETGKGLSIDDRGTVFDTLGLVGVPDRTTLNRWSVMRSLVYGACGM